MKPGALYFIPANLLSEADVLSAGRWGAVAYLVSMSLAKTQGNVRGEFPKPLWTPEHVLYLAGPLAEGGAVSDVSDGMEQAERLGLIEVRQKPRGPVVAPSGYAENQNAGRRRLQSDERQKYRLKKKAASSDVVSTVSALARQKRKRGSL